MYVWVCIYMYMYVCMYVWGDLDICSCGHFSRNIAIVHVVLHNTCTRVATVTSFQLVPGEHLSHWFNLVGAGLH